MKQIKENMKRKKHGLSSKWLVVLLFLVIGSSIALALNAYLKHSYFWSIRGAANLSNSANGSISRLTNTSTATATNGYPFAVQAHHLPATAVASPGNALPGGSVAPVFTTGDGEAPVPFLF